MSQEALADRADVSVGMVRKIEQGDAKSPSIAVVARIVEALGLSLDGLAGMKPRAVRVKPGKRKGSMELSLLLDPNETPDSLSPGSHVMVTGVVKSRTRRGGNPPRTWLEIRKAEIETGGGA